VVVRCVVDVKGRPKQVVVSRSLSRAFDKSAIHAVEPVSYTHLDVYKRQVLRRLEEKGYVTHTLTNRTFLYRPAEAQRIVAGRAVRRIIDWFCDGSVESLLVGMVDSNVLDSEELKRLAARIGVAKKGKKS